MRGASDVARFGFSIGIQFGAMAGMMGICAIINVIFAIPLVWGQRTERLMLKYHDELRKHNVASDRV
jgi:hypothetical protein